MPLPRHMLESTKHQPVTNARASGDYAAGSDQFDIALSSLFYWAIGVAPSKDDCECPAGALSSSLWHSCSCDRTRHCCGSAQRAHAALLYAQH